MFHGNVTGPDGKGTPGKKVVALSYWESKEKMEVRHVL